MKSSWKRDLLLAAGAVLFIITSLHLLRDVEKRQMREFLKSSAWDRLPMSDNIEHRHVKICVTLFGECVPPSWR
jgi:hypothetical protein